MEEKKLSIAARRKLSRAAKRTAKKRLLKKKLLAKRMKTPEKLKASAQKAAKNVLVKKITGGKSYSDLSITQKQTIDNKLKPAIIAKVARKMLPKIKAKEKERLKRVRANTNTVQENKHGVLTLKVNGSHPEVSAHYEDGKLKPYIFKTREDAKKHCKKVGGKPFESFETGRFYVEFTKIDGPINEKSVSKSQQRLFGMVHAYNKGELKKSDVDGGLYSKIKKIANGMTKKDTKKMAKTDHDDLPEKVPTNESKENQENLKDLKAILDVAKMLSDKSPYFKGRGSKKEYIKMLVHKIQKLSESKKQKLLTKMDAYKKVRKTTMPKSIPMKNKKAYDRKDFKRGKYD
jgi:hypothetical protein